MEEQSPQASGVQELITRIRDDGVRAGEGKAEEIIAEARRDVRENRLLPVPVHLRDAHYGGAKQLGHGDGYQLGYRYGYGHRHGYRYGYGHGHRYGY